MSESIRITTRDGSFSAYVARPDARHTPVIVVLQEVFGVNSDMRATCQELADRGYIAICPDLFWRQEPGLDLSHWTDAEWKKGLELYNAYNLDTGVSDVADTIAVARSIDGGSGKVEVMGFCLGGLMTFLTAARRDADGAVAYYPGSAEKHAEEAAAVSIPMIVHLGEEDEFISKDAQQKMKDVFAGNSEVKIYSYPGCSHALAHHTGVHYDASAARIANERTWAFFDQKLR
jgi:carboxymethylenebutenolidase